MIKHLKAHLSEDLDVIFYRGTTIQRLTSRISKIKKNYDWILVHVGTNNISVDSVEIKLQKYRSLANEILRINPKARIIFSSIIPRDFNYFENDYWKTDKHIKILNHKIEARKNYQLITPGYIVDSLEFSPLPSCDQPSFLSSWPQHSGSALPWESSFLPSWSKHPASWPLALPSISACPVSTASCSLPPSPSVPSSLPLSPPVPHSPPPSPPVPHSPPPSPPVPHSLPASLPVPRSLPASPPVPHSLSASPPVPHSLPASLPVPRSLPVSLPVPPTLPTSPPVPPTGYVQFLVPIVPYMSMVQFFLPFHSVAVSYPHFYVPLVLQFLPAAVSSLPTCSQSVVACTLPTHL
ncbi:hypothetical protein HNY73_009903 [Argiope bruennichi]|uniref:SGNH hydrolase-type esterase domain-containing protein n=1 Tax=Argiope bruennichi TaxID=94029 RepID=A0A8T0FDK7_ARGBR|nr:hypothetical protein HNY73_009903 [Argiope bruennichi]